MDYTVVETPLRSVAQGGYKGYRVEVVTGYSITTDNYPIHVYVQRLGPGATLVGPREKVKWDARAGSQEEAFEAGFDYALKEIDGL